jgi:hypothetical protein
MAHGVSLTLSAVLSDGTNFEAVITRDTTSLGVTHGDPALARNALDALEESLAHDEWFGPDEDEEEE